MAARKRNPVEKPVPVAQPEPIEEAEPIEEVITVDQVVLFENLKALRILLPNGNFIRFEERGNGIYWTVPA